MTQLSTPSTAVSAVPVVPPTGANNEPTKVHSALADVSLDELLNKVRGQIQRTSAAEEKHSEEKFVPIEPDSLVDAKLSDGFVEALVMKYLLSCGTATGRQCADQVALPFKLIDAILAQMKVDQLVVYRGSSIMNDYTYQLTDMGRERARRLVEHCSYFGAAPVALDDYVESVQRQSLTAVHPTYDEVRKAFDDLLLDDSVMRRLGPAINSGRGLFLFGAPGNGKSSIAERITRAFGSTIWIPKAICVDGEVIRMFDPSNHEVAPVAKGEGLLDKRHLDRRWIRIRRPTIIVGGELTMNALEVTLNTSTGICEAAIQLKSNCGTLVIDDFGRQRMPVDELLNRWIVPLEKRFDFLNLPNGKKIQVPFDQLIVFSTNLEPKDLVDDAFLRRIPYKVEVKDPSEEAFRDLFQIMSQKLGVEYRGEALDYLIDTHYKAKGRPFRCCQPRDLLMQIRNYCVFLNIPAVMTPEYFDLAAESYFAIM